MIDDSAEELQEEREKAAKLADLQRDGDLEWVLSTPEGRRFYWRVLDEAANLHGGSFTGDPLSGAFNEGKRSVGITLMLEAQRVSSRLYLVMIREHLAEVERRTK